MVIYMNIAIFTEVTEPVVSGISSYTEVLRRGLENLGHKVLIVTSSIHTKKTYRKSGVVRCPAKKSGNKYGHECISISDDYVEKTLARFGTDIIHIQTDTKIGYMGLLMADRLRCPVVFTIHDYYMDRYASEKSQLVWRIRTWFEKRHFCDMLDNAQIITSSNKRAAYFIRSAERKRKVWLIPSATDRSVFDYRNASPEAIAKMRQKLHVPEDAVVAVFAGDLSIEKNLEFFLAAFSKYLKRKDNIHLLIVGSGSELEHLKKITSRFHLNDRVHFTGSVAHRIMPAIYSSCDIYVCSSDDSLMSMSFVEAMSCGLPILVKEDKEKYVYNMIKEGVNGFVYKDGEGFAGYLKKMAEFDDATKQQLKLIVRKSMKNTDANYMAKCTVQAYEQAIKIFQASEEESEE